MILRTIVKVTLINNDFTMAQLYLRDTPTFDYFMIALIVIKKNYFLIKL